MYTMTILASPIGNQFMCFDNVGSNHHVWDAYSILHTWVNTHTRDVTNVIYLRFEATSDVFIHLP